jgi:hypothetical protein
LSRQCQPEIQNPHPQVRHLRGAVARGRLRPGKGHGLEKVSKAGLVLHSSSADIRIVFRCSTFHASLSWSSVVSKGPHRVHPKVKTSRPELLWPNTVRCRVRLLLARGRTECTQRSRPPGQSCFSPAPVVVVAVVVVVNVSCREGAAQSTPKGCPPQARAALTHRRKATH